MTLPYVVKITQNGVESPETGALRSGTFAYIGSKITKMEFYEALLLKSFGGK